MWVLDTNTLIYFFKGEGNVAKEILARSPSDIGIPSIVLYELEVGIAKSTSPRKRMGQLGELNAVVQTLPFGAAEALVSAAIRSNLEKKGKP
ncbi:MAG: PIN domain-containing protein, partial [Chromatiaceae bacterium]